MAVLLGHPDRLLVGLGLVLSDGFDHSFHCLDGSGWNFAIAEGIDDRFLHQEGGEVRCGAAGGFGPHVEQESVGVAAERD